MLSGKDIGKRIKARDRVRVASRLNDERAAAEIDPVPFKLDQHGFFGPGTTQTVFPLLLFRAHSLQGNLRK